MSFFLRTAPRFTPSCHVTRFPAVQQRTFVATTVMALKESDRHVDNQHVKSEQHKEDSLKKQKEGKGHWKPELASDSEEAVAADRYVHSDHSEKGIKELQQETRKHAEEKHKHGTSQDPGL